MTLSQPLYDRSDFFDAYLTLPRSQKGLEGAPEWPQLRDMVGDVTNFHVLDLGCGLGWFSRYAARSGAARIDASDNSSRMIERAREMTESALIHYEIIDLNSIELGTGAAYDLAYSSLTLHYLSTDSLLRLLRQLYANIKSGGRFVFSVEHPIYTAPSDSNFCTLANGREVWPLDQYAKEGIRETDWLGGVTKYHRTISTYLQTLLQEGFVIESLVEWMPSKEDVSVNPSWKNERDRPMFLLIRAKRS